MIQSYLVLREIQNGNPFGQDMIDCGHLTLRTETVHRPKRTQYLLKWVTAITDFLSGSEPLSASLKYI